MQPETLIHSVYSKNTKNLFKSFLVLIEDLHTDHSINFKKLKNSAPEEMQDLIDQANYFDQEKLQYIRKKILDMGNESIRGTETDLENFTISFKF